MTAGFLCPANTASHADASSSASSRFTPPAWCDHALALAKKRSMGRKSPSGFTTSWAMRGVVAHVLGSTPYRARHSSRTRALASCRSRLARQAAWIENGDGVRDVVSGRRRKGKSWGAQRDLTLFGIWAWGAHLYARRGSDLRAVLRSLLPVLARLLQQRLLVLLLPPGRPAERHPGLGNGPEVPVEEARYAGHLRRGLGFDERASALRSSPSEAFDAAHAFRRP